MAKINKFLIEYQHAYLSVDTWNLIHKDRGSIKHVHTLIIGECE